ncbi:MAG: prephenate dehydratase [Candidatus Saccharicenans sp.]
MNVKKEKAKRQELETERLDYLRYRIDRLDEEIMGLMDKRMELAVQTSRFKRKINDPVREQYILNKIKKFHFSFLPKLFAEKIALELIKESKRLQHCSLKLIGFQGEHGAYSEIAASLYNPRLKSIPCPDFSDVFTGVELGLFDYGIVPVENSIEGQVSSVNDLFIEHNIKIVGEVILPIHHCLLTTPGQNLSQIKVVMSHPQALAQCKKFLQKNNLEVQPCYDTAGAAKLLTEAKTAGVAVIAGKKCADIYGLSILKENIEDFPSNQTRFLILARKANSQGDKCSIVFSIKHQPGTLCQVLRLFSEHNINLTRIESRPNKTHPGEYFFLLDFEGSIREAKIKVTLNQVQKQANFYKFLGCYNNFNT